MKTKKFTIIVTFAHGGVDKQYGIEGTSSAHAINNLLTAYLSIYNTLSPIVNITAIEEGADKHGQ